jgi:hypothetical protein
MKYISTFAAFVFVAVVGATAMAQTAPTTAGAEAVDAALDTARAEATQSDESASAGEGAEPTPFGAHLERQAAIEVQLGLRFFQEFDDYRAITALKRYAVLDNSPAAHFLSSLMIGQIYHRNKKPQLSALAFERAVEHAPDAEKRAFAYLLGVQELCLPLAYYVDCRSRLQQFGQTRIPENARDLVDYQVLYTDVVLRSEYVSNERVELFRDPELREKAAKLVEADRAFREIDLKSPALAGVLSGVIPGAGQMYNGRWLDGLMSLGFVGLFGAATWYAFAELESVPLGIFSAVLGAGFYSGGIYNAVTDAQRINAERYLEFFDDLKQLWPRVTFAISGTAVSFGYAFDWPGPTLESETKKALEASDGAPTSD